MTDHPMQRLARIVTCLSFCLATATPGLAQTDPIFGAAGFQQNRDYFSAGPRGTSTRLPGNLIMTYTDLVLPGNAGHDVRFERTVNGETDLAPDAEVAANQSVSVVATGPTLGASDRVVFLSTVTGQVVADHGVTPSASATATDTFTMTAPAASGRYAVQWLAPESATPLAHGPGLVVPGPRGTDLEAFYYDTDAIGSVRQITNAVGGVVERRDYTPFGAAWPPASWSADHPLAFGGKERDATGLDYLGARYHGSLLGRFTTVDPVMDRQKALVDPQQWNRYTYVWNNPFRYVDPDGRCPRPAEGDDTVCVALFIKAESALLLRGDGRDFSADSEPGRSRVFVHVNVEKQTFSATVNASCFTGGSCKPALKTNDVAVAFSESGGFTLTVQARNSILPGPSIDATFTFSPDGRGGFSTLVDRDAYPSAEAYLWHGGQAKPLFQLPERTPAHLLWFMPNERLPR